MHGDDKRRERIRVNNPVGIRKSVMTPPRRPGLEGSRHDGRYDHRRREPIIADHAAQVMDRHDDSKILLLI
jgi:hypothetical protein